MLSCDGSCCIFIKKMNLRHLEYEWQTGGRISLRSQKTIKITTLAIQQTFVYTVNRSSHPGGVLKRYSAQNIYPDTCMPFSLMGISLWSLVWQEMKVEKGRFACSPAVSTAHSCFQQFERHCRLLPLRKRVKLSELHVWSALSSWWLCPIHCKARWA